MPWLYIAAIADASVGRAARIWTRILEIITRVSLLGLLPLGATNVR
jgi:hypothetical protein